MSRRRNTTNLPLIGAVILASAALHVVMWPVSDKVLELTWGSPTIPTADGVMEVALMPIGAAEEEEEREPPELEPEPEVQPDGKLVQLDRVVDERPPDEETDHVSEFDSRVDKETRAPNRRPQPMESPPPGKPTLEPGEADPTDAPTSKSLSLDARGSSDEEAGQDLATDDLAKLSRGTETPQGASPPARAGFLGTSDAMRKTFGGAGTMDALDELEPGSENILNSRRYKYASFFNRVRNSISQHWSPAPVHRAHDPDGRIYGNKRRRTDLIIRLNKDGSLAKIMLGHTSDAPHLDEEAIRSVRAAAPFDNPPAGLVDPDTGYIEFGFGFIFEFGKSPRVFGYQR